MKLIVGLGNPGEKYENTRHNVGFMVVEKFLKDFEPVKKTLWQNEKKFKSDIALFDWQPKTGESTRVILAKPQTFMNNSGMAVSLLAEYYKVPPDDIWLIYDELDLPLGSLKIRFGGAAAGHHGVESVMEHIGTDKFWRFRLGIGLAQKSSTVNEDGETIKVRKTVKEATDYVLGSFQTKDENKIKDTIKNSTKALETALEKGLDAARNQFNTK
jgi:PTH1 family peptidyl-tRNA hydrolase